MTLQKTKTIRNLILISVCVFTIGMILGFTVYSCVIHHIAIMTDLKSYEKSLDPELCVVSEVKVNLFDANCKPEVEILDCG